MSKKEGTTMTTKDGDKDIETTVEAPAEKSLSDVLANFMKLAEAELNKGLTEAEKTEQAELEKDIPDIETTLKGKKDRLKELTEKELGSVKIENSIKNQLATIASKKLGLDEAELKAIGLEPRKIVTRIKSGNDSLGKVRLFFDGKESEHSRRHTLSIVAQFTGRAIGSDMGTNEMVTKLELAGINPNGSWAYEFKNLTANKTVNVIRLEKGKEIQFEEGVSGTVRTRVNEFISSLTV
jgi:hypothetical protein